MQYNRNYKCTIEENVHFYAKIRVENVFLYKRKIESVLQSLAFLLNEGVSEHVIFNLGGVIEVLKY